MKILALVLALVAGEAYAQSRNYKNAAGTVIQNAKVFVAGGVINSASAALTEGMVVCPDLTNDDAIGVDLCAAAGDPPLCVIVDESCAVGARCKCQTKGYFAEGAFGAGDGNAVAGKALYADTDGTMHGDTSQGEKQPFGIALDASSTTGDLEIYINL